MIIRGANGAITRNGGCTVLDMRELLHLMTRCERLTLIRLLEAYNEAEKLDQITASVKAPKRASTRVK